MDSARVDRRADPEEVLTALRERMGGSDGGELQLGQANGIPFLLTPLPRPLFGAFTTRHGGVSRSPYDSLNLKDDVGDRSQDVAANLERLAAAIAALDGLSRPPVLVSTNQEHGARVVGAAEYLAGAPAAGCDGLVFRSGLDDGLAALLRFADCVPVILVSEIDAAVAHGGWRGLLAGVIQQAAAAMTAPPGKAFIGPSIGPCCYTVDDDVAAQFQTRFGEEVILPGPRLDLWTAVTVALHEIGVPSDRVVNPRLCTACNLDLFYSYRAEGGVTGRQGALVWAGPLGDAQET